MLEKIMNLIYPIKCGFCNVINKEYTCKKCEKKLEYICVNEKIQKCEGYFFDYLISSYYYIDIVRKKLLEFKFLNKKYLYNSLSENLLRKILPYKDLFDCIIAVPISFNRFFERGYNQSYLIAKYISKKLNKPLIKFTLLKIKNNFKQSGLEKKDRIKNVTDVYKIINKFKIKNKRILLVDDIYTTGATVNECSRILKQNGVLSIIVATIAKTKKEKFDK